MVVVVVTGATTQWVELRSQQGPERGVGWSVQIIVAACQDVLLLIWEWLIIVISPDTHTENKAVGTRNLSVFEYNFVCLFIFGANNTWVAIRRHDGR